jgi:hypothetical protein
MDGGGHDAIFSGLIIENNDEGGIQHYNPSATTYEDIHLEWNGAASGVDTVVGDSSATTRQNSNVLFRNCHWGGGDATTYVQTTNSKNITFTQPRFGMGATNSIDVDSSCRKIRVRQGKDEAGVNDPSNTITHENKVTIPAGNDPTTADYDVTRAFDGATITNGTQRWVVVDETAANGVELAGPLGNKGEFVALDSGIVQANGTTTSTTYSESVNNGQWIIFDLDEYNLSNVSDIYISAATNLSQDTSGETVSFILVRGTSRITGTEVTESSGFTTTSTPRVLAPAQTGLLKIKFDIKVSGGTGEAYNHPKVTLWGKIE